METLAASLRAARALLNLSREAVDRLAGFDSGIVGRLERGRYKLIPRDGLKLRNEFEKRGILFEDQTEIHGAGVRWKELGRDDPFRTAQFRAARAMLNLSQVELANVARIDKNFIARLELNRSKSLPAETVAKLEAAINELGVEITKQTETLGAGVRLRKLPVET